MHTAPSPDADERRDNAAFAALLEGLSRPGTVHDLPEPGAFSVARALIDRECRACADDPETEAGLRRLGASMVPPELAGHAFLTGATPQAAARLARLPAGDVLHPEAGATVIVSAGLGNGTRLRLSGPGIERTRDIRIAIDPDFWAVRSNACRYPTGLDIIVVDGARLLALPRSTKLEVL